MFNLRPPLIGIDIGNSSIKVVQFTGSTLTGVAYKEIPPEVKTGKKEEISTFIAKGLPSLLKENKFEGRNVVMVLSGPQEINISSFTLPAGISGKDLQGAVIMELKKRVTFNLDESFYDFHSRSVPKEENIRITAAASPQKIVRDKVQALQKAKLIPVGFNVAGYALENLLRERRITEGQSEQVEVFMDIGAKLTTMNFFKGGRFQFTREISLGGEEVTQALVRPIATEEGRKTLTYAEAETVKREYGIIEEGTGEKLKDGIPTSQVSALIRPFLERLLREINRAFTYYQKEFNSEVNKIFLWGGELN